MRDVLSTTVRIVALAGLLVLPACDDDEDLHNPGRGVGTNPPSGGTSGGGSDGDTSTADVSDADTTAADGDTRFDREACRQTFIENAVTDTAWYDLQCQKPGTTDDAGEVRECQQGTAATEVFLQFDRDGTYWLNQVDYRNYGNEQDWSGWCRDPAIRDGELTWEMIGCRRVRLTTGCGETETARWTDDGRLLLKSIHGPIEMTAERPQELRVGRMRNPLGPSGCWDDRPAAEPMCTAN